MSNTSRQFGLLAQFDTPAEVMEAARQVRDAGYKRWDVYTPFPVHGMDSAMGLRNSRVGWFAFIGGASGFFLGMLMIWWMNASDYSLVVGGKPLFSPIFAFPVSYECTILLGAIGSLVGMLITNRLPRLYQRFSQATHDKFFIAIESADPKFDDTDTRRLLEMAGGQHIEEVRD
jgi:hypothetical protein